MISFAILLFVGCATAGVINPFEGKIVGGQPADIKDFPWQVSVQYNTRHICGGSIIANKYILTAAHCTNGKKPNGFAIRAGSTSRSWGGSFINVGRIIQHPDYNSNTVDYDFSILELQSPLTFDKTKQPIALADEEPAEGIDIAISGWGALAEGAGSPDTLMAVIVQTISREECSGDYAGKTISNRMICARADGKDSCQGDSGGPMVDKNRKVLCGVVSWGIGCARPTYPGVYSNIANQLDWIRENAGL